MYYHLQNSTHVILSVEDVQAERGNDRAWLTLDIDADLRSTFNWNTKQASLRTPPGIPPASCQFG